MTSCTHQGCGREAKSRGYCNTHYERRRTRGEFKDIANHEYHGMKRTKEYTSWSHIKERCFNESCGQYDRYGGRGIGMDPEWADSFLAFYRYVGPAPSKNHSIDRIDNDRGYEPGNVRWATDRQQSNNRRHVEKIDFRGAIGSLAQHCRWNGLIYGTLKWRRQQGWTSLEALEHYTQRNGNG